MINWEALPEIVAALIPIVAIIGAFTYAIMRSEHKTKVAMARTPDDRLNRLSEENLMINRQIYARLEAIEQRLAGIEKSLKEIPQQM
jgi:hypothetical protein